MGSGSRKQPEGKVGDKRGGFQLGTTRLQGGAAKEDKVCKGVCFFGLGRAMDSRRAQHVHGRKMLGPWTSLFRGFGKKKKGRKLKTGGGSTRRIWGGQWWGRM